MSSCLNETMLIDKKSRENYMVIYIIYNIIKFEEIRIIILRYHISSDLWSSFYMHRFTLFPFHTRTIELIFNVTSQIRFTFHVIDYSYTTISPEILMLLSFHILLGMQVDESPLLVEINFWNKEQSFGTTLLEARCSIKYC